MTSDDPSYLLADALGSVRGVTDDTGSLVGSSDYNVFGSVRAASGASSTFGYTGEQFDAETGFTYLRARYLNPALGRFISADTVQPNAPGTQGWNLYAYVANNPTTWVDPSGHEVSYDVRARHLTFWAIVNPGLAAALYGGCVKPLPAAGPRDFSGGTCVLAIHLAFTFPVLACAFDPLCFGDAWRDADRTDGFESGWTSIFEWTTKNIQDAVESWPVIPGGGITIFWATLTVSEEVREHILHGDPDLQTGGHMHGSKVKDASWFPKDWTADDIIGAIEDIANDRMIPLEPQEVGDKHEKTGVIDGVEIKVIIDTNEDAENAIRTGFPTEDHRSE